MGLPKSFCLVGCILALPLLLSQCAHKPGNQMVSSVTPEQAAAMSPRDWQNPARDASPDLKVLPLDRLESLGDLSLKNRDYQNSLLTYLQILRQNPERDDVRYRIGVILLLTGKTEAAKQQLGQVLIRRPDLLEAHEALGLVHFQEKQYPQALGEFQAVLEREPQRAKARHLLGLTYLEMGNTAKAISELKMAVQADPRQAASYFALGQAYIRTKDYPQAITWLKKAQPLNPQDHRINHHLGMALAGLKQYPEAMEAFMKNGDEAQAYNNIGVYYFMDGRYEEAAKCFQHAIELRPSFYGEARANLKRVLEKLNHAQDNI
jgi:tetratricopeptide (TPR) repeat protein